MQKSKVLFNEKCSICNFEIQHYKKRSQLNFQDCSFMDDKYLKKLHVIFEDGKELSGVDAFIYVWERTDGYNCFSLWNNLHNQGFYDDDDVGFVRDEAQSRTGFEITLDVDYDTSEITLKWYVNGVEDMSKQNQTTVIFDRPTDNGVEIYTASTFSSMIISSYVPNFSQLNSLENSLAFSSVLLPIISISENSEFNIAGITERFAIREQPIMPNFKGVIFFTDEK